MKPRANSAGLFICHESETHMPRKPKRPCGVSGCPRFAEDGSQYCAVHEKQQRDSYNRYVRAPDK